MNNVKVLTISDDVAVYVVGDIHGCYYELIAALKAAGFKFGKDVLIAVGDIVDRGTENLKCLQLLKESWFHTVKGNHEDFCWQGLHDERIAFYHKMQNNGGRWFYELFDDEQEVVARMVNRLPILIELHYKGKKYGFVHADVPVQDWELLKEMVANNDMQIDSDRSVIDHCLWARSVVNLDTVEIAQVDQVFLGHTVLPEIKHVGNCTFLDTGAVFHEQDPRYKFSVIKL